MEVYLNLNMKYFIIINNEEKGPFKLDELKSYAITSETLVWHHGLHEWTKAGNIIEISKLLELMPPPLPKGSDSNISELQEYILNKEKEKTDHSKPTIEIINKDEKKHLPTIETILVYILLCLSGIISGYLYTKNEIKSDFSDLHDKIDKFMNYQKMIIDGERLGNTGQFMDKEKKHYHLYSGGGFSIYQLYREFDEGFVKIHITAGDLEYTEGEYLYGKQYFWGKMYNPFRGSVDDCYTQAYKYLLLESKENIQNSYTPYKYKEIESFPYSLNTNYFTITEAKHPTDLWTHYTTSGRVYNKHKEVTYNQEYTYYSIQKEKEIIKQAYLKYIIISSSIGLILSILLHNILRKK